MPEQQVVEAPKEPVKETPAAQRTEQQITDTYLEKRAKGETVDLPVPPPTVPAPDLTVPEPQTVDAYLAERGERKRKERGGKQARIDELTKEKAELEAKNAELAKATKPPEPPKSEEPKPAALETPKTQPKMADYTDIDKYNADLALWAASQTGKVVPEPAKEPSKEPPKPEPITQLRKEEFDRFLERGKVFIAGHPDFNTTLEAAHVRGLTISEGARVAITKLAAPEVAYWLAKPENDLAARKFMGMDDMAQVVEIGRIAERLAVKPADFVSSAPEPGLRLTGSQSVPNLPLNEITDTDEYIRQRKLQRRQARGR